MFPISSQQNLSIFQKKLGAAHAAIMTGVLRAQWLQDLVKHWKTPTLQECRQITDYYLALREQLLPMRLTGFALGIQYSSICGTTAGQSSPSPNLTHEKYIHLVCMVCNAVESVLFADLPPEPLPLILEDESTIQVWQREWKEWEEELKKANEPVALAKSLLGCYGDIRRALEKLPHIDSVAISREMVRASDDSLVQWRLLSMSTPESDSIEWTTPDGPSRWAKLFGFSRQTFMRRIADGKIRHQKLSSKSYVLAIDDLPHQHQGRYRSTNTNPSK